MKYAFEKLMAEKNLKLEELPEDAKIGIKTIKDIEKAISMAEKKGKKVNDSTISKIRANDKWVVNEILDYLEETDENDDEMPHDEEEIIDDINSSSKEKEGEEDDDEDEDEDEDKQSTDDLEVSELGLKIESELDAMFETGKKEWTPKEFKKYTNCYNTIFENYEEDGENGIDTNKYRFIETENEIYTLNKK